MYVCVHFGQGKRLEMNNEEQVLRILLAEEDEVEVGKGGDNGQVPT